MKARFVGGSVWRKGYSGSLKDGRSSLQSGDMVEGDDATRLLQDYPRDFEEIAETKVEALKVGVDRMLQAPKRRRGRPPKVKAAGDSPHFT